jgi:hypothetical protein
MQVRSIRLWDECFTSICCLLGVNGKGGGEERMSFLRGVLGASRQCRRPTCCGKRSGHFQCTVQGIHTSVRGAMEALC